ncbi:MULTISPECIES: hypothetical protein [unclassified Streptomyces]|uniref:hypothetical protein n=1 Tax=unclassified Streptomyces TaxID=2593676 RepID=UPI00278C86A8|nr:MULTISPECIES: hypothetical protein [unclassified Streptomyces]
MQNTSVHGGGALSGPGGRSVWKRARRRVTFACAGWAVGLFVVPVAVQAAVEPAAGAGPAWGVAGAVLVCALVGVCAAAFRDVQQRRMRPVLTAYEWQEVPADTSKRHKAAVKHAAAHFTLPDPDHPERRVGVIARRAPTMWLSWKRTLEGARRDGFWFAGDPRFGGVIAPRHRPHLLLMVRPKRDDAFLTSAERPDDVSEQAWQRAVRAKVSRPVEATWTM